MNMTCHDVEAQLDLLAAGECDQPMAQAIEGHLENCPACAASYQQSKRLLGLLTLHMDAGGPQRVRQRIEQEERPARRRQVLLPYLRRITAVAAMLLLALGLSGWLGFRQPHQGQPELQLTVLALRAGIPELKGDHMTPVRATDQSNKSVEAEPLTVTLAPGQIGAAFRRQLIQDQRDGKLPPPAAVSLVLALKNIGNQPLSVRFGDAGTDLMLEVDGPGVFRVKASKAATPEFLRRHPLRLVPGEKVSFGIDHLLAGAPGKWEYIYLTEPGDYTIVASLRITAGGHIVTVASRSIRLKVND